MSNYQNISFEKDGHIGIVTLKRPQVMNALNREMTQELHALLEQIPSFFPDIRVILLTGEGKGFCSGADLSRMGSGGSENRRVIGEGKRKRIQELAQALRDLPQPVIAAINGAAVGAGFSIAMASDIRIAAESSKFSAIFVKRGLVPDTAASNTIAAIAGFSVAAEMSLTGSIYSASWALSKGLITKVVPDSHLIEEAIHMGRIISANPPLAVRNTKKLLRVRVPDWVGIVEDEDNLGSELYDTKDQKEAVDAFLEKRPPNYVGE